MGIALRGALCACLGAVLASCGGGTMPAPSVPSASDTSANVPSNVRGLGPQYRLVVLPSGFMPSAINDAGVIVGVDNNTTLPVEYIDGHLVDLPLIAGDTAGAALDINRRGQIVGYTLDPQAVGDDLSNGCPPDCAVEHAVLFEPGVVKDLGALPASIGGGRSVLNSADVINDHGTIVGDSGIYGGLFGTQDMTLFAPGAVRPVQANGQIVRGSAFDINDRGEIVGDSASTTGPELSDAFSYPVTLGCSPPPLVANGFIFAIDNAGDTVWYAGGGNALYCLHGAGSVMPTYGVPGGINDRGEIIGYTVGSSSAASVGVYSRGRFYRAAELAANSAMPLARKINRFYFSRDGKISGLTVAIPAGHATLFSRGTLYDLNSLVANNTGIVLEAAVAINNKGDIVGYTIQPDGTLVTFLLVRVNGHG